MKSWLLFVCVIIICVSNGGASGTKMSDILKRAPFYFGGSTKNCSEKIKSSGVVIYEKLDNFSCMYGDFVNAISNKKVEIYTMKPELLNLFAGKAVYKLLYFDEDIKLLTDKQRKKRTNNIEMQNRKCNKPSQLRFYSLHNGN